MGKEVRESFTRGVASARLPIYREASIQIAFDVKKLHDDHLCTWFQLCKRAEDPDPAASQIRMSITSLYEDLKPILIRLSADTGVRFQRSRMAYVICGNSMRNARNRWLRNNPDKAARSKKDGNALTRASAGYEAWSSDDQDGESDDEDYVAKEKRIERGKKATRALKAKRKAAEEARLATEQGKGKEQRDDDYEDEESSSPA